MNKAILLNFFARVSSAAFGLLVSVLISRELGAEIKGDHALFVVGVSLIHLFTNLFGGGALGYLAPRHPLSFLVKLSTSWSIVSGFACGIILWALGLLPEGFEWSILVSGVLYACWSSYVTLLLGRQQNAAYNFLQFLNPLMSAGFLWLLLFFWQKSLWSFAYGYTLSQGITVVVSLLWVLRLSESRTDWEPRSWKNLFTHGIFIQLANLTQFMNYRVLFYLIDEFFGRAFLGVYSNALALAESVWMISKSISTVQFSKIVNTHSDAEARTITKKYIPISGVVSFFGIALLLLIPASCFTFLFGKDFSEVSNLMVWLSPAVLALSIGNIYAHYFAGKGLNRINFYGSLINLVALVLLFFVFKNTLKEFSAPLSASLSFVITALYQAGMYYWGKAGRERIS
jgi:O-antigen/teichoic acid export membrane protein